MRLSTSQMTTSGVREMLLRQADLQYTQLQLATQKRVLKPSDDPVAATTISFMQTEISQLDQYNRNGNAAKASNELEESVLSTATDILFRIRNLMVELGNGLNGKDELSSIAKEMGVRLDELVGIANTKNASGDYLFGGSKVKSQPYTKDAAGNFIYNGDQDQRMLRISSGVVVAVSDPGFNVFNNIKNGNGKFITSASLTNTGSGIISPGTYAGPPTFLAEPYSISFAVDVNGDTTYTVTGDNTAAVIIPPTLYQEDVEISFNGITTEFSGTPVPGDQFKISPSSSQDIFTTIKLAIDAVEGYSGTAGGKSIFFNQINSVQKSMDLGMKNVDITRGKIGSRLNAQDSAYNSNLSLLINAKTSLSAVQDLDVVEASTRFSQQLVVLEASQASFVRVQDLNLFNFL